MHKEYRINVFRAGYILTILTFTFLVGCGMYGVYSVIRLHSSPLLIYAMSVLLMIFSLFFYLSIFYFNRLVIRIEDEDIIYKMPDKIVRFKIKDIYKIEKDFSFAGTGYYVFFYNSNRKKRHIKFTQDLENSEELIEYLQKKSGIKMRWEGTLNVENEKRPIIKWLKIIWNVFIVVFIIGILVVYPFMAAMNKK